MTVLAPDPVEEQPEPELLIKEARQRQRRRRLAVLFLALAAAAAGYVATQSAGSAPRSGSLLARPLHFPALGLGGRCPVSSGYMVNTAGFGGMALGHGPVRVLLGDAGDIRHGRVLLGAGDVPHWLALQTLWFAMPGYQGPFVVRGARLGRRGPIEVQPGGVGLSPGSGPLVVPAGDTTNTYYTNWRPVHVRNPVTGRLLRDPVTGRPATALIGYGYRTVPGSTWVKSPGCYAWQVDGRGFSEVIVVDAVGVYRPGGD